MKNNAREVAVCILTEIYKDGTYNNVALRRTLDEHDELSKLDKAFITQIVNGTVKNTIFIDHVISQFVKMKIIKMDEDVISILRSAVYQIFFMDKVPESAVCNEAVNIAKNLCKNHISGFVNGVIRNIIRNKSTIKYPKEGTDKYLSIMYSYPEWIVKMWLRDYSYDTVFSMCKYLNTEPEVSICVNTLKISVDELGRLLTEKGIKVTAGKHVANNLRLVGTSNIAELDLYIQGYFYVQDESSMISVKVLDPKPGENILDICAAPGGKSYYASIIMNNQGNVSSRDVYPHKIDMIEDGAKRLGIKIINAEFANAEFLDRCLVEQYDKVIVDAPCSGLGILRKKPDIKLNRKQEDITELVVLQRKILTNAAKYVKSGGILVYSTCTISKAENQDNVEWFLKNFEFALDTCDMAKDGYMEIMPHIYDTDGFFVARLRKA